MDLLGPLIWVLLFAVAAAGGYFGGRIIRARIRSGPLRFLFWIIWSIAPILTFALWAGWPNVQGEESMGLGFGLVLLAPHFAIWSVATAIVLLTVPHTAKPIDQTTEN